MDIKISDTKIRDIKISKIIVKLLVLCTFLTGCSPIVELPAIKNRSSIKIAVEPTDVERTIIVKDVFLLDTIILPVGVGKTLVENLSFGTYGITIEANTYGTVTDEVLLSAVDLEKKYALSSAPAQVYSFSCPRDGKFRHNDFFNVRLKTIFPEVALKELIRFDPEIPFEIDSVISNAGTNSSTQQFRIIPNLYELYNYDSITVIMNDSIGDLFGSSLDSQLDTTIFIDTTYRVTAIWDQFIQGYSPTNELSKAVTRSQVFEYKDRLASQDSDIRVTFRDEIVSTSFNNALSISPGIAGAFSYNGTKYIFIPADPLPSDTRFTVKMDTTLRFADSTALPVILSWDFKTLPLYFASADSYPINGTTMAIRDSAFVLTFNTAIDSASLHSGFSITPPLDSISFSLSKTRNTVYVHHALLELETEYTIELDSAITDRHGIPLDIGYFENSNQIIFSVE